MNKLYIIRIYYKYSDFLLATLTAWTLDAIEKKRHQLENDGLQFELISDSNLQLVYHAR